MAEREAALEARKAAVAAREAAVAAREAAEEVRAAQLSGHVSVASTDPVRALPAELVHAVLALLPPAELVSSVWSVSRAWRDAALDEALWRRVVADMRADVAAGLRMLRRAPCLAAVRLDGVQGVSLPALHKKIAEAMQNGARVRKLSGLKCSYNVNAVSQLLEKAAPHLEELTLATPNSHRQLFRKMSSLRVLEITCFFQVKVGELPHQLEELRLSTTGSLLGVLFLPKLRSLSVHYEGPAEELPPLPDGACGLRRLTVEYMEPDRELTLLSLLGANAASLRQLHLRFTDATPGDCFYFPELAAKLRRCGFRALERVVLSQRLSEYHPGKVVAGHCRRLVGEIRDALRRPDAEVEVLCSYCDGRRGRP